MELGDMKWLHEPDRLECEAHGFRCIILRNPSGGHLCGYVGLPDSHPCYDMDREEINVGVHGGLTFTEYGDGFGLPKGLYWVGFDCAHGGDLCPYYVVDYPHILNFDDGAYRDIEYVQNEVESLAEQLKAKWEPKEDDDDDVE